MTNAQPVLSAATGTATDPLAVPTQFNGDRVFMMQSLYADGTNAGTATWTAYQAYGHPRCRARRSPVTTRTARSS